MDVDGGEWRRSAVGASRGASLLAKEKALAQFVTTRI